MNLSAGASLSHYRLVEKIGEGGMGVVWKALDTTLDRHVAIKILPAQFTGEPERLARFEREAKLLASLNHPGIAAIFGLHEHAGVHFLAMELVDGEDLAQRLSRGSLDLESTLGIATQIAAALETAHECGVVHRDLKPANVQVTPDGVVKLLDFGLAKALDPGASTRSGDPSLSPTLTSAGTAVGVILGTAAYMSPEQARGQAVDKRADIWALGSVIFEMLTGQQVFRGETISDNLAAVLRAEPQWELLPAWTPPGLRGLLRRCLEKSARLRLRDAGEARIVLDAIISGDPGGAILGGGRGDAATASGAPGGSAAGGSRWQRFGGWVVAAISMLITIVAIAGWQTDRPAARKPAAMTRFDVTLPADQSLDTDDTGSLAIAPDGRHIAYTARIKGNVRLYIRSLDQMSVREMPGTEGAEGPFFSPDGRWIGYFADGMLKKVSIAGGPPLTLCAAPLNRGADWGDDDMIILSPRWNSGLIRVSSAGGEPEILIEPDVAAGERTLRWPDVLPGARAVIYTVGIMENPGDYEDAVIEVALLDSGERRPLGVRGSIARYVESGHIIYSRGGVLLAVPFDIERLEVTGSPVPVREKVAGSASSGVVYFDISANGTLLHVPGTPRIKNLRLAWVDRDGGVEILPASPNEYHSLDLSPDGSKLALSIGPGRGSGDDVWIYDLKRDAITRFTFDGASFVPKWTPDGSRIAYASAMNAEAGILWKASDGSSAAEILTLSPVVHSVSDFSPDGKSVIITEIGGQRNSDILIMDIGIDETPRPLIARDSLDIGGVISPDGKWLAHASDESGRAEIFVRPFPELGGKWQVSIDGGQDPRWSADGRELFYRRASSLIAVPVQTTPTFSAGKPYMVIEDGLEMTMLAQLNANNYDVSPDGKRFIVVRSSDEQKAPDRLNVTLNWFEELRRLSPTSSAP